MELNHWYTLTDVAGFTEEAPAINAAIANYLGDKPFMVTEFNSDTAALSISFDGKKELYRLEEISEFSEHRYGSCWIYGNEYEYFEEVHGYSPEENEFSCPTEVDDTEDCIIVVTSPGEVYTVGGVSPTRFTLSKAKNHAEFILDGNVPGTEVNIFRLETTAKVVKEVKFF